MGSRLRRPALVVPAALAALTLILSACGGAGAPGYAQDLAACDAMPS